MRIPVSIPDGWAGTATVEYATADGTAASGSDYRRSAGTFTVRPATRRITINVVTVDDEDDEPHETLTVTLSAASGLTIGAASTTVTITDNDDPLPPPQPPCNSSTQLSTLTMTRGGVDSIQWEAGDKVYAHCWRGTGRTSTVTGRRGSPLSREQRDQQ